MNAVTTTMVITTHSHYWCIEECVVIFYSLFIVEFTYFMYKIANKATFIVVDTFLCMLVHVSLTKNTSCYTMLTSRSKLLHIPK